MPPLIQKQRAEGKSGVAGTTFWYAREWAVKCVPPEQIAVAVKVWREFPPGGGDACRFRILNVETNPICRISARYRFALVSYFRGLQRQLQRDSEGWLRVPTHTDGFRLPDGSQLAMTDFLSMVSDDAKRA